MRAVVYKMWHGMSLTAIHLDFVCLKLTAENIPSHNQLLGHVVQLLPTPPHENFTEIHYPLKMRNLWRTTCKTVMVPMSCRHLGGTVLMLIVICQHARCSLICQHARCSVICQRARWQYAVSLATYFSTFQGNQVPISTTVWLGVSLTRLENHQLWCKRLVGVYL